MVTCSKRQTRWSVLYIWHFLLIFAMDFIPNDQYVAHSKLGRHIKLALELSMVRGGNIFTQIFWQPMSQQCTYYQTYSIHIFNPISIHSTTDYMHANCDSNCWFMGCKKFVTVCASLRRLLPVWDSLRQPARQKLFVTDTLPTLILTPQERESGLELELRFFQANSGGCYEQAWCTRHTQHIFIMVITLPLRSPYCSQ